MEARFVLKPGAGVVEGESVLLCVAAADKALRFDGDSAEFAGAALEYLRAPRSVADLRGELGRRAGLDVDPALVDELVRALVNGGIVTEARVDAPRDRSGALEGLRVVLALTGAVSSADAPRVVLALQRRGAEVRVVMSRVARRFVSRITLEAMTHSRVESRVVSRRGAVAPHIEIGRWADAILIAPASATTLSRIARGDLSDIVSAIAIASPSPVMLAPSMNQRMLAARSIRRNLEILREDGFFVLRPSSGVEVADAPGRRRPEVGGLLSADALVQTFEAWIRHAAPMAERGGAAHWNALYSRGEPAELPWIAEGLGEELQRALLAQAPPPRRLLDVGCGLGAQVRAAVELGYQAIGIDSSTEAIRRAAGDSSAPSAVYVLGDFLEAPLEGRFDVILDRGTFHTLGEADRSRYAASVERLSSADARLVIVHDAPAADRRFATKRLSPEELVERLPGFSLISSEACTLRKGDEGHALLTVLRRR